VNPFRLPRLPILAAIWLVLLGCIAPIKHEMTADFPAALVYVVGTPPVMDGRVRFREIFCQLLMNGSGRPEPGSACDDFLLRLNDEPLSDHLPRPLPDLSGRYRVLVVPGFLNECFASIALPFEEAITPLSGETFTIETLMVSGRSSSDANALHIAESIEALQLAEDERLVLVGHSKGAVDILHCVVNHPAATRRVAAVISVAGAINGSPLALKMGDIYADIVSHFLPGLCNAGDEGALESLRPAVRLSWTAAHPLPEAVHFFSLATLTRRDHINTLLKTSYDLLWPYSPRNDGLLLMADQLIPGGTLLGYANTDHLSVVLPLENKNALIAGWVKAPHRFPRTVLLKALLVYAAEVLESPRKEAQ